MNDTLMTSVDALRQAALDPASPIQTLREARREVMRSAAGQGRAQLDRAAERLVGALGRADVLADGSIALTLGAIVEMGGSVDPVAAPIVAALRRALVPAASFHRALKDAQAESPGASDAAEARGEQIMHGGDFSVPLATARMIGARLPDASAAYDALSDLCLPTIACLTRDATRRAAARADASFAREAEPLRRDAAGWLYQLLVGVGDAEWVVLHATERRGFVVRVTEINDNWCIPPLIANALVASTGGLPSSEGLRGGRPPPELVACLRGERDQQIPTHASGQWEVYTFLAIDPSGALRASTLEDKVWNEGIPLDIPALDGARVIVLGSAMIGRSWRGARSYGALGSDIRHVRTMGAAEVETWFRRCGAAPR